MQTTEDPTDARSFAVQRLRKKSEFRAHLLAYVLVNGMFLGIWAATGHGFFWPVFFLLGWGIGLVCHWWDAYRRLPISEDDIQREMRRLHR